MMNNLREIKTFMSIRAAARATGISEYHLRQMCRDGALPGFYSGVKFNVDVPSLIEKMRQTQPDSDKQ